MEWISVKDRLPEPTHLEDAPYVQITDGKEVSIGWYEHNLEEQNEKGIIFPEEQIWHDMVPLLPTCYLGWPKVTHWMSLPSPPVLDADKSETE